MPIRLILHLVILLIATGPALSNPAVAEPAAKAPRPNILLLLADNWAWPHASIYGDKSVQTPTFDQIARNGVLFTHAFCHVPSCSAARAVLLTGQVSHRLGEAANLWSNFPERLITYPALLEKEGYRTGYMIKGWGPGRYRGKTHNESNPAGERFESFAEFLNRVPNDQPFCFWFGSHDPHQPWDQATEHRGSLKPETVEVPPYLPDHPVVRATIADYYAEVQRFDHECGELLELLKKRKQLENTLVIMVGDNGWQMPRGLANVYDFGTRVSMAVQWPARIKAGQVCEEFISFEDFAPTFLDVASIAPAQKMTGGSFLPLMLAGSKADWRKAVFLERERHANVRAGDRTYPCRAVRTKTHLYIQNLYPDRWPAGDPKTHWAVGPFGDVDNTPVKELILSQRDKPAMQKFFQLGFAKRPAEELYDLSNDLFQMKNLAGDASYKDVKQQLARRLHDWRVQTGDPRLESENREYFDRFPYFGGPAKR